MEYINIRERGLDRKRHLFYTEEVVADDDEPIGSDDNDDGDDVKSLTGIASVLHHTYGTTKQE